MIYFKKDSSNEQSYKTICKVNQNQYLNPYNSAQNEMTHNYNNNTTKPVINQYQQQQQRKFSQSSNISSTTTVSVLTSDNQTLASNAVAATSNHDESATQANKSSKLRKSKSQNEVHGSYNRNIDANEDDQVSAV